MKQVHKEARRRMTYTAWLTRLRDDLQEGWDNAGYGSHDEADALFCLQQVVEAELKWQCRSCENVAAPDLLLHMAKPIALPPIEPPFAGEQESAGRLTEAQRRQAEAIGVQIRGEMMLSDCSDMDTWLGPECGIFEGP